MSVELAEAFLVAVEAAAPRLEAEHGLVLAAKERTGPEQASLSFAGRGTMLTVTYDGGEIDATLARDGAEERPYQLVLVLALAGVPDWRTRWPRIIGVGTTGRSVGALVQDVVRHAGPWLRGDEDALRRLRDFRTVDTELKTAQFGDDRRPAEEWDAVREAWDDQELDGLVRAIEELPEPRRQAERDALEYARTYGGVEGEGLDDEGREG